MDTINIFAFRLKNLMDINNLQNQEFAKILKIEPPTLTNYTKGNRFPNADILNKICDYFGCSMDYLFGRTDEINTKKFEFNNNTIEIEMKKDEELDLNTTNELIEVVKEKLKAELNKSIDVAIDNALNEYKK